MAKDKLLKSHSFTFNPNDNGGEALTLTTKFYDNGGGEVYVNQELSLMSYCNSASFNLCGTQITSGSLRELANQLDKVEATLREVSVK